MRELNTEAKKLTWEDFTVNFHSRTASFETVRAVCENNAGKVIDLRPYM